MGKGKMGFGKVLEELDKLRDGSTVILYPRNPPPRGGMMRTVFPFYEQSEAFDKVVRRKNLRVVFTSLQVPPPGYGEKNDRNSDNKQYK